MAVFCYDKALIKEGSAMRHKRLISLLVIALAGFGLYSQDSPLPAATQVTAQATLHDAVVWTADAALHLTDTAAQKLGLCAVKPAAEKALTTKPTAASTTETPVEDAIKNITLAPTYTYSFEAGTPTRVRTTFEAAIAVYNQTGIVTLTPGISTVFANHITFGTYAKPTPDSSSTIELGEGGPAVVYSRLTHHGVNHSKAAFNTAYQLSVKKSVALHEIGHALGLAHSNSLASVMYPMDQGRITLSAGDLATLKLIYARK